MFKTFSFCIVFFLYALSSTSLFAVEFGAQQQPLDLTPHLKFLIDPNRSISIAEVSKKKHARLFAHAENSDLSQGYTSAAIWVRLEISSSLNEPVLLELNYPLIDHIELYKPLTNEQYELIKDKFKVYPQPDYKPEKKNQNVPIQRFRKIIGGDQQPFNQREIDHRNFIFDLGIVNSPTIFYLRLTSDVSSLQFPLRLWTYKSLADYLGNNQLFLGLYYGIMSFMFVFSLMLYAMTKDRLFMFFAGYLLSFQLLQLTLNGFAYQFFWPTWPVLQNSLPSITIAMTVITALVFARYFLNIRRNSAKLYLLYKTIIGISIVGVIIALFFSPKIGVIINVFNAFPIIILIISASVLRIMRKDHLAWYFLIALSLFFIGALILILMNFGLINNNFFTQHAMQIGALGEFFFLAIALGLNIKKNQGLKILQIAKASSELKVLNETLEEQVMAQTKELQLNKLQLKTSAFKDDLTGLLNHRATIKALNQSVQYSQQHNAAISIAMLDIDYFKKINDKFGHQLGDQVLLAVSRCLSKCIHKGDILGRYGGGEFLIVSKPKNDEKADVFFNHILEQIRAIKVPNAGHHTISISIGAITGVATPQDSPEDLLAVANKALRYAKDNGRDQLVLV